MAEQQVSTNKFSVAKWIVDTNGLDSGATHTTIAAALTSASSGETIFIKPGTYTENLTLVAGVNLAAFTCDAFRPNVQIIGKLSASFTGIASLSGIRFDTNSDFILEMTGANVTEVNFFNCFLNAADATAISNTGSEANQSILILDCIGSLGTTGIAFFAMTNGKLRMVSTTVNNPGVSVTANTFSGNTLTIETSFFGNGITTSGSTAVTSLTSVFINIGALNVFCFTSNSTVATTSTSLYGVRFNSGTATPLVIGASSTVRSANLMLEHANAAAVSGAGTLIYSTIPQTKTVGTISPTATTGKGHVGMLGSTAPTAGYIGEKTQTVVGTGAAVALTTNTLADMTSISLTKGIWDISVMWGFTGGAITGTQILGAVSTSSASFGTQGDNQLGSPQVPTAGSDSFLVLPVWRASLASTTTYYASARAIFTVGSVSVYGRMSATRVA